MTPSELLSRAADLIRDTAAAATRGPWSTVRRFDRNGNLRQADFTRPPVADGCAAQTRPVRPHEVPDYEWIALVSPDAAPHLEAWLRHAQVMWEVAERKTRMGWVGVKDPDRFVSDSERRALDFARSVLGEEVHDGR